MIEELKKTIELLILVRDCNSMMSAPAITRALIQQRIESLEKLKTKIEAIAL